MWECTVRCMERRENLEMGGVEGSVPLEISSARGVIVPAWKPNTISVAVMENWAVHVL